MDARATTHSKSLKPAAAPVRQVHPSDVAAVVAAWTGIAVEQLAAADAARLSRLPAALAVRTSAANAFSIAV